MLRAKDHVRDFAYAEFEPVVALQALALYALTVNECSVLAALIDNKEIAILGDNHGVITRDPWIGNYEVFIDLAPHGKRRAVEHDGALLIALHINERRKDT